MSREISPKSIEQATTTQSPVDTTFVALDVRKYTTCLTWL